MGQVTVPPLGGGDGHGGGEGTRGGGVCRSTNQRISQKKSHSGAQFEMKHVIAVVVISGMKQPFQQGYKASCQPQNTRFPGFEVCACVWPLRLSLPLRLRTRRGSTCDVLLSVVPGLSRD